MPAPTQIPAPPGFTLAVNGQPTVYLDLSTQQSFAPGLTTAGGLTFWGDDPDSWDGIWFAGHRFPGLVVDMDIKCAQRRDKKTSPGRSGQKATHLGYEPSVVTVKLEMWTPKQWGDFQQQAVQLRPPPGKKPPAPVAVFHPALSALAINEVEITEISPPKPSGKAGIYVVSLRLEEFMSQPAKVTTPKAVPSIVRPSVIDDAVNKKNAARRASNSGLSDPNVK